MNTQNISPLNISEFVINPVMYWANIGFIENIMYNDLQVGPDFACSFSFSAKHNRPTPVKAPAGGAESAIFSFKLPLWIN